MPKRRAEAKSDRLTSEEVETLARQLNEAILGTGSGDFHSKHTFVATDLVAKVRSIEWFGQCGESRQFDVSMPVEYVKNWTQANKALKSRAWENATLEARNQLTEYLAYQHRERYCDWNKITVELKEKVVIPLGEKVWEPFRQTHRLDVDFLHSVQWNVLAALMENAYMDCKHACFFFHELLSVYEAGHLPCGWIGKWPKGKLVAY